MIKADFSPRRIAADAVFAALALITFMIENLFPPMFFPGAKMGLANIFSLAALVLFGPADSSAVLIVRTVLGSLFAGNVSALMYSLTGGAAAMTLSAILIYFVYPRISIISVSVASAVLHNIVQNLVFVGVSGTAIVASYMPYLALTGVLSGIIVGGAVMLIFKRVPLGVYEKALASRQTQKTE